MKKIFTIFLMFALLSQTTIASTSIEERMTILSTYYENNLENPDPTVFDHYNKWHEEDVVDLKSTIKKAENQERLKKVYDSTKKMFVEKCMNFEKLKHAYAAYAITLSHDIDPEGFAEEGDINKDLDFHFSQVTEANDELTLMTNGGEIMKKGKLRRFVPFVAPSGILPLRLLNQSFGIWTPIYGLPLKHESYDTLSNQSPSEFYLHDWTHTLNFTGPNRNRALEYYAKANKIAKNIQDKKRQQLCDLAIYNLFHENGAVGFIQDENSENKLRPSFLQDRSYKIERYFPYPVENMPPYNYQQGILSEARKAGGINTAPTESFFYKAPHLEAFLNADGTRLLSLEEFAAKHHLPMDRLWEDDDMEKIVNAYKTFDDASILAFRVTGDGCTQISPFEADKDYEIWDEGSLKYSAYRKASNKNDSRIIDANDEIAKIIDNQLSGKAISPLLIEKGVFFYKPMNELQRYQEQYRLTQNDQYEIYSVMKEAGIDITFTDKEGRIQTEKLKTFLIESYDVFAEECASLMD